MNVKVFKKVSTAITCCALISTIMLSTVISASADAWFVYNSDSMKTTQYSPNTHNGNSYAIQIILKRLGYSDVGKVDGYFGTNTKKAVKEYQTDKKLTVDGIVGKNTWNKLNGELQNTCLRSILRNKDKADIGIFNTFKIKGSSTTTDCFFNDIGNDSRNTYHNLWLCDNEYTGHGTNGSYTLSGNAMVMNTLKKVDNYTKS